MNVYMQSGIIDEVSIIKKGSIWLCVVYIYIFVGATPSCSEESYCKQTTHCLSVSANGLELEKKVLMV